MTAERTPAKSTDHFEADLGELLDELSSESVSPAASSVAATTVSLAAALTTKSARRSAGAMKSAAGAAAQGDSLRRRASALVSANARAYERAAAALPTPSEAVATSAPEASDQERDLEIREALTGTNDALLSLLEVACDVCLLAALIAEEGQSGARADAAAAALLAEASARAVAHLIEISLLSGGIGREAGDVLATASAATASILGSGH